MKTLNASANASASPKGSPSPRPWHYELRGHTARLCNNKGPGDEFGDDLILLDGEMLPQVFEDAQFALLAVNAHDDLIAALEKIIAIETRLSKSRHLSLEREQGRFEAAEEAAEIARSALRRAARGEASEPQPDPKPCPHLDAPLQEPADSFALTIFRNWRKCTACGEALWEDGSPLTGAQGKGI